VFFLRMLGALDSLQKGVQIVTKWIITELSLQWLVTLMIERITLNGVNISNDLF
jgi:hypothetical protein